LKHGWARPCETRRLCLGDHRLLHASRMAHRFDEPGRVSGIDCAKSRSVGDLRLNDAGGDRQRVGGRLRPQHRGAQARSQRRDGHKFTHPVKDDDRDPVRRAKPHSLDRDDTAPSGHDDRRRHARARIISKATRAVANVERPAPSRKACVVGFRRDDARLDLKPPFPKGVAFRVRHRVPHDGRAIARIFPVTAIRGLGERRLPQAQQSLPRSPAVGPRRRLGIGAIDGRAGRARIEPRQRRRNVDRITTRPPHADKVRWVARRVTLALPALGKAGVDNPRQGAHWWFINHRSGCDLAPTAFNDRGRRHARPALPRRERRGSDCYGPRACCTASKSN
jgi:hypothetical protein